MVNLPRRLWSSASAPKSSGKTPYPEQIIVDVEDIDDSDRRQRCTRDEEELKFWKEKALRLEDALVMMEEKVSALEAASFGKVLPPTSTSRSNSVQSGIGLTSPVASFTSATSAPASTLLANNMASFTSMPSVPTSSLLTNNADKSKTEEEGDNRKEVIVQQLVSEMERLIELHTNSAGEGADHGGEDAMPTKEAKSNDDDENSKVKDVEDVVDQGEVNTNGDSANNDDADVSPGRPPKIETSTLEELVTRILAATDKDAPKTSTTSTNNKSSSSDNKTKKTKHNKKPRRELYQLSCKKCIGQNFVGSTKTDLKDKVKENFAVVWQVVQTAYGKGDAPVEGSGEHEHSLSFRASSFAHHVAEHCKACESEDKVYSWCLRNVKVERISKQSLNRHDSI